MTAGTRGPWLGVPAVVVAGAVAWLALAAAAIAGLLRLTLIDLLFLLAPLVIVPLGLRLLGLERGLPSQLLAAALALQPVGSALAVLAFLLPTGIPAAIVAAGWLLVAAIAGIAALANLAAGRSLQLGRLTPAAAIGFMAFGALWLVLSRAGVAPLGLSPQIVELTAVHFHYTGFAATLLAALALRGLADERGDWHRAALVACGLMIVGSPVLAAGWGTPLHVLQIVGAFLVATGVMITAAIEFFRSQRLLPTARPRLLLRLSALAPLLPMVLAVEYSAGHLFGLPTLSIEGMALIHGDLNALGFSLLGLIAWSLAGDGYLREGTFSRSAGMTSAANSSN